MHSHSHCCQSRTAVELVCASRDGLSTLASQISAFIDSPFRKHWTIERACEHDCLRLLQRLIDNGTDANKPQLYRSHVFSRALAHAVTHDNDMALLECLRTYCSDGFASLGMEAAARLGKLHVMQWIEQHYKQGVIWSSRFALAAAGGGHLDVLQWLATKFQPIRERVCEIITRAIAGGQIATVQWLLERAERDGIAFYDFDRTAFVQAACEAGHLEMTKYLLNKSEYKPLMSSSNGSCFRPAAASGNLELVEWLHSQGCIELLAIDIGAIVDKGHVDVVRWMLANDPATRAPDNIFLKDAAERAGYEVAMALFEFRPELFCAELTIRKFSSAAAAGDLELIKWLFARMEAIGWPSEYHKSMAYDAMSSAASNGHLEIVQWLFANLRPTGFDAMRLEWKAISAAAENGHADVVEWLHTNRSDDTPMRYNIEEAARRGHLELVKWMLANGECGSIAFSALVAAVESGDLATLQWLHSYFDVALSSSDAQVFDKAVGMNYVHIMQWLHERGYEGWSPSLMDSATSVEMIKWLHYNHPGSCSTDAMDNAAERGDFDTLLFLHEHRSEGCTVRAAARAQENDSVPIVQWLMRTYPSIMDVPGIRANMDIIVAPKVLFWAPQLMSDAIRNDGEEVNSSASDN